MNTIKPISTVGYNTKDFLDIKLKELTDGGIISFYAYIYHKPEPKDNGDPDKKTHYHLYLEPNKRTDTMWIQNKLKEYDPTNPEPLKAQPFRFSKDFGNWYLYGIHDPIYLMTKGLSRHYTYTKEDITTNDKDYLNSKIQTITEEANKINYYYDMNEYQNKGYDFMQYAVARNINPMQLNAYRNAWHEILYLKSQSFSYHQEEEKKASTEPKEQHLLSLKKSGNKIIYLNCRNTTY